MPYFTMALMSLGMVSGTAQMPFAIVRSLACLAVGIAVLAGKRSKVMEIICCVAFFATFIVDLVNAKGSLIVLAFSIFAIALSIANIVFLAKTEKWNASDRSQMKRLWQWTNIILPLHRSSIFVTHSNLCETPGSPDFNPGFSNAAIDLPTACIRWTRQSFICCLNQSIESDDLHMAFKSPDYLYRQKNCMVMFEREMVWKFLMRALGIFEEVFSDSERQGVVKTKMVAEKTDYDTDQIGNAED